MITAAYMSGVATVVESGIMRSPGLEVGCPVKDCQGVVRTPSASAEVKADEMQFLVCTGGHEVLYIWEIFGKEPR